MLSTRPNSFHSHYQALVSSGHRGDPRSDASRAATLTVRAWQLQARQQSSARRLFVTRRAPPRGLYIHASRPRQDMLMDLFFSRAQSNTSVAPISTIHGRGA